MNNEFDNLGKILWLWGCSPLHRKWPIESALSYVIPAIENQQYVLLLGSDGIPRSYASWAWLNSEVEKRYILDPNSLQYDDWKSGDRLWFIDFIAPFNFKDTIRLRRLVGEIHGKHYLARSIRLRKNNKAQLKEHMGGSTNFDKSRELKRKFYDEAKIFFAKNM